VSRGYLVDERAEPWRSSLPFFSKRGLYRQWELVIPLYETSPQSEMTMEAVGEP
jgi:hypothetical protein